MRSQWLSLDPYMRGRMSEARSYAKPTQVGEPMTGQAVGEVVESSDPRFAAGDTVVGQLGWQVYGVARGGRDGGRSGGGAVATALDVLGATGLTAYFGLMDGGNRSPARRSSSRRPGAVG